MTLGARGETDSADRRKGGAEPSFEVQGGGGPVASFRLTSWRDHRAGLIAVSSANRPHALVQMDGPVDAEALRRALWVTTRRHRLFGGLVRENDGTPVVYSRREPLRLIEIDSAPPRAEQPNPKAREIATNLIWERFNLLDEPLARAFLVRESTTSHLFGLVMHHFLSDAVSMNLVLREILLHYDMLRTTGRPAPLPPAEQYASYLSVLPEWVCRGAGRPQLDWWLRKLRGAESSIVPGAREARGTAVREEILIPEDVTSGLRGVATASSSTLFTILLAAQATLIRQETGRTDVIVTAVTSGRDHPGLIRMVGYIADRLHYRIDLRDVSTFGEVVERCWSTVREGQKRRMVRSDFIAAKLAPENCAILGPAFNFIPRPASLRGAVRSERKTEPVTTPTSNAWRRVVPGPPPEELPPTGVDSYWLELKDTGQQLVGHVRHKAGIRSDFSAPFCQLLSDVARMGGTWRVFSP